MEISTLVIGEREKIIKLSGDPLRQFIAKKLAGEKGDDLIDYPTKERDFYSLLDGKEYHPPDLIILHYSSVYGTRPWLKMLKKWGAIPFILNINGEAFEHKFNPFNYNFSFKDNSHSNLCFNCSLLSLMVPVLIYAENIDEAAEFSIHSKEQLDSAYKLRRYFLGNKKERFCNFIYSHGENKNSLGTVIREGICQAIMRYKKVDCAGKVMNNTDELLKMERADRSWINEVCGKPINHIPSLPIWYDKMRYISNYKFTIASENTDSPNYFTEKIMHPLIVGSIPIYWGTKDVTNLVNPKAFVNCRDYSSLEKLVARIKEIDQNEDLYNEYINAPPFLKDSIAHQYSQTQLMERMTPFYKLLKTHIKLKQVVRETYPFAGALRKLASQFSYKPLAIGEILIRSVYRFLTRIFN